ncbi:MAG: hypothetical protein JXJ22_06130 [Bacteroidales bacterium]|nr:hypothetical protein [Bacteroidales bacterium]
MKPVKLLLAAMGLLIIVCVNGQNNLKKSNLTETIKNVEVKQSIVPADSEKVVINHEMVRRFNEYQPEGELVTFYTILENFDFESIQTAYAVYQNSTIIEPKNEENLAEK